MVGTRSSRATCAYLKQLLDEGWEIEQPVYMRPHWRSTARSNNSRTYHVILSRENRVNLVSVPEGSEIEQFLAERGLAVDSL
jgi:hypothetical protein